MQFLVGLNEDYKIIRGSILMMKPLPNIDQVYSLIQQEEKQRSLSAVSQLSHGATAFHFNSPGQEIIPANQMALATQHKTYNPTQRPVQSRSHHTNYGPNNNFKGLPRRGIQDKRQLFCDYCRMSGYTVQRCYKLHGYPPGHKLYRGRKMAALAQSSDASTNISGHTYEAPNLHTDQTTTPAVQTLTS